MDTIMGKYNDVMDDFKDSRKKKKEPERIKKCQYFGCPLSSSSSGSQGNVCNFHETPDYAADVTQSIVKNKKFIDAYSKMVRWSNDEWFTNKNWLTTNPDCPMTEGELPTLYLQRFYTWLGEKIKSDSTDIIQKRLQYKTTGTYNYDD